MLLTRCEFPGLWTYSNFIAIIDTSSTKLLNLRRSIPSGDIIYVSRLELKDTISILSYSQAWPCPCPDDDKWLSVEYSWYSLMINFFEPTHIHTRAHTHTIFEFFHFNQMPMDSEWNTLIMSCVECHKNSHQIIGWCWQHWHIIIVSISFVLFFILNFAMQTMNGLVNDWCGRII